MYGFAYYRLPDSDKVYLIKGEYQQNFQTGFVILPFNSALPFTTICGQPSNIKIDNLVNLLNTDFLETKKYSSQLYPSTPYSRYISGAQAIIDSLKNKPNNKIVYSRVIERKCENVADTFLQLSTSYPHAYVFCFFTPNLGFWMGASPETLCEINNGCFNTMALAGTKNIKDSSPWDKKNIEEQAIVSQFLISKLRNAGLQPIMDALSTALCGPVKHLKTIIKAQLPSTSFASLSQQLIKTISPTPALCGHPRNNAVKLLNIYEMHNRECYGGCCGPVQISSAKASIWVNLRCMKIVNNHCNLFVGGGLTHLSTPNDEWHETEMKASTLINFL